jgi:two-component system phosphate regulon sensor histidine kinase PhoR
MIFTNPGAATHSLSARLILTFGAIVLATTVLAGAPAYWIVRTQLQQQAWERVADGGRITATLFQAEQDRLDNLAVLTSQRPTLRTYLETGTTGDLSAYLRTLQTSVELDLLAVYDRDGALIAASSDDADRLPPYDGTESSYVIVPGPEPVLLMTANHPIGADEAEGPLGYVMAAAALDDAFVEQIAGSTGLEQAIVIEGQRVANSLPAADGDLTYEPAPVGQTGGFTYAVLRLPGSQYYSAQFPIYDAQGTVVAYGEVLLPIHRLASAQTQALLTLILSTLLIAFVGAALGTIYARRIASPLERLTAAAQNISAGDLETPIPALHEPAEVATLAAALEESRASTYRALHALAQSKEWSETLIRSIVEGIVTFDEGCRIDFLNEGAERITGWTREEARQRPLDDLFKLADGSAPFSAELPLPGKKRQINVLDRRGQSMVLAVTSARLAPPSGGGAQSAIVLRDITEEQAVQNLRSYFLTNISHEFRTPLSALKASVELLLDEFDTLSPANLRELLNSLNRSVTGLQTLIDNLLESARIEAGRFRIRRCRMDLTESVGDAIHMTTPLLDRRRQRLTVSLPVQLPPVDADPTRLTQVVVNLLSNASKYSPVGAEVGLTVEQVDKAVLRVSVSDEGPGIQPEQHTTLFQRFVRLDADDGRQYGVGLGLWVVKVIVEEHSGEVGVDQRPGGGSIFWFTIPLAEEGVT